VVANERYLCVSSRLHANSTAAFVRRLRIYRQILAARLTSDMVSDVIRREL
jgi:hypothetical protein